MPELLAADSLSGRLLNLLQTGFPIVLEPYAAMAHELNITEEKVINAIVDLRSAGVVRQISPVLDARRLGYYSTLVALKVPAEKVKKAENYLQSHQGISHGYEREHEYNIWVTLSMPPGEDIHHELDSIASHIGASAIISLPALRIFKLRTNFSPVEDDEAAIPTKLPARARLTLPERRVINALQRDLELTHRPFEPIAKVLEMENEVLLGHCRSLLKKGVIRRYGASINHYRAGYKANAMTCWAVEEARANEVGTRLARLRNISHCYLRETSAEWRFNLFAMLHGNSRAACLGEIERISLAAGLPDYSVLFSTHEFKKTRITYNA